MTAVLDIPFETFEHSPNGCQCVFIKIGEKGIKVYRSREERDLSYVNQLKLHRMDLAPGVGYKCEAKIGGCTHYAFETECVECYDSKVYSDLGGSERYAYRQRFTDGVAEVAGKMHDAGLIWCDDHNGNVGYDEKTGEWLLIDCADAVFGDGTVGIDAVNA
jgi:hypothetical protein